MRLLAGLLMISVLTGAVRSTFAQEPSAVDSAVAVEPGPTSSIQVGLYGFSARGGVDVEGDGQALVSVALDIGSLFVDRLRMRPSGEIGVLNGDNTYVANLELVYRFTSDADAAVPYIGTGIGLAGRGACATDPNCPALWVQFALGFELRVRDRLSWLLEYHPEDAFRRQRMFIGLTTRRGP